MAGYFLKIDGIAGESQNPRHQGEIEVESFSWSETYLASAPSATGAGKVHMQDLHVTKPIDKASPLLMLACASGQHFTSAVLTAQRPGEEPQDYFTITLSDLMVNSYQIAAPAGRPVPPDPPNPPAPADRVAFSFSRIEIAYRPQRPDGTFDAPVSASWNVTANRKI
jgi:type VI secretion system secreted protein Hcp